MSDSSDSLKQAALRYHTTPTPGKISISPTKPLSTQRDLALAYSPGVAEPCIEIEKDPLKSYDYTSRGNMVAVITNGTAVLGLGAIGALASKPVMEGKSVLFKKFANLDSIDIEVEETDVQKFVDTVARLEPSFGGINLEDIKAPECFEIEKQLKERMNIPVFHDDQHGTAIIVGAALLNWLELNGRDIKKTKLVASGAGAAAIACLNILMGLGLPKENIIVCDREGVVYKGRNTGMDSYKEAFAADTDARTLGDAIEGADVFLGLSAAGALKKEMVDKMIDTPLIMALANPTPEIMPEEVREVRPNATICTGRSDYTNQVNNVLCFPYLFRGALDVGATAINEEMKLACVKAIAELARKEATAEVANVYSDEDLTFGPDYLIPKPFDPRLIVNLSMATAKAAMESGVATRPIEDFEAYKEQLKQYFMRSNLVMRPVYEKAQELQKRIVYAEGEDDRVLRAVQSIIDDNLAQPILIGRRKVVANRIERLGLRLEEGTDFEICDPEDDPRYREYWTLYHSIMERKGVTPEAAKTILRTNTTVIAALMVIRGEADGMVCGVVGKYQKHLKHVCSTIGLKPGVETAAGLACLITPKGTIFIGDTHVNTRPSISQLSDMTVMSIEQIKRFGIEPKVALLSHSDFGSHEDGDADKMRTTCRELRRRMPDLEIDGEMNADTALDSAIRENLMPNSKLKGSANLLVMPSLESANITYNTVKVLTDSITIGPMLLGVAKPANILTPAATARSIVNITALTCAEAGEDDQQSDALKRDKTVTSIAS